jgi:hypothetical protein
MIWMVSIHGGENHWYTKILKDPYFNFFRFTKDQAKSSREVDPFLLEALFFVVSWNNGKEPIICLTTIFDISKYKII